MTFKNLFYFIFIAVFAITACKKSGTLNPKPPPTTTIDPNVDVYVAGGSKSPNGYIAAYWKNGVPVLLGANTFSSLLYDITVQGTDVYAAGEIVWIKFTYHGNRVKWQ
jgi:hypothetical protein